MAKQQARAAIGPSGVVGDSARGKISRGAWEAREGPLSVLFFHLRKVLVFGFVLLLQLPDPVNIV